MSGSLIELDGSLGEGGGQILRTSLTLSLLTRRPFHLRNVRAGRSKPGLQPQHLMSVRAAATIGQAQLQGATLGSSDLVFEPGIVTAGKYHFSIGTAGSTGLVLHTLYLPLALAGEGPSQLTLGGGTHVTTSPCFDYLNTTWRPYLKLLGLSIGLTMRRAGFYPRGGGVVVVDIEPCRRLQGLALRVRAPVTKALCTSIVAGLPEDIAHRQARRAGNRLKEAGLKVEVREETWPGGPGTVLAVTLDTQPVPTLFFGLGARGKRAERVADEAVDQVVAYLDAAPAVVDAHSADQIVLPLALAQGPSFYTAAAVTQHLVTNIAVIRQFVDREIECQGEPGRPGSVQIR
jgi:RNA 3'-terminal phosphate cyclase (ATP)